MGGNAAVTTGAEAATAVDEIRFNQPAVDAEGLAYMVESVRNGHPSASGPFAARAASLLREGSGAQEVLLTTSCTAALEMSAMLLDLQPGDTVIVPSFTFVSSGLAFAREGARILFCDIEPDTLGLDPDHLASLLDDTVRAVVPVHYAGIACDLDGVLAAMSDWPEVSLIEDNAHGLYGRWRDRPLGSIGRFATLSFHETKNFVCGEGGALLINQAADVDRARVLYDKGTNRMAFFLGQVDKYSWKDNGSSFGMSDILAAYLYGQLEKHQAIQASRRRVFERYERLLSPHAAEYGFRLPVTPPHVDQAYHMFYVLLPDNSTRDTVLKGMRTQGVQPTFHYIPLHNSEGGRRFAARPTECPVTEEISGRLLRLPFYNELTDADCDRVVEVFLATLATAV
jgi:dTDP-4-amino-4,6-dideoxygalactose transaminase